MKTCVGFLHTRWGTHTTCARSMTWKVRVWQDVTVMHGGSESVQLTTSNMLTGTGMSHSLLGTFLATALMEGAVLDIWASTRVIIHSQHSVTAGLAEGNRPSFTDISQVWITCPPWRRAFLLCVHTLVICTGKRPNPSPGPRAHSPRESHPAFSLRLPPSRQIQTYHKINSSRSCCEHEEYPREAVGMVCVCGGGVPLRIR